MRCGLCLREIVYPSNWQLMGDVKCCEQCVEQLENGEVVYRWNKGGGATFQKVTPSTIRPLSEKEIDDIQVSIGKKLNVDSPQHYNHGNIETIDIIKNNLTDEMFEGYLIGNITKYISRYRFKNGVEDLEKAKWYLEYLIKELNK